ncbi:DEAD/DEAH box helicase [Anaeromicrobium sediminis]|uniref:ATP-dependent helicase n=1 Tax=Anaeromicrobium sediminis TaxID=1478221 RepID=A0A267MNL8_9FIRM|nr:DEAD/DEAH box helicase [Anaeromicrobium sediminis]PAB61136.1 ATP-dependent helicase [Anaeromicrobium sediminis]
MTTHDRVKSVEMKNKQLIVILKPEGFYEIDWQEIKGQINEEQIMIQEKLYKHFRKDRSEALFSLGLSEKITSISESLSYLRSIAVTFVKKLSKKQDIELSGQKIIVTIKEEEIKDLLNKSPYLIGDEYLNSEWIRKVWKDLNKVFSKMKQNYNGSVEEFLKTFNYDVHLHGRIFFHLVEKKGDDYPFAFMGTYLAEASKNGATKHLPLKNALIEYEKNEKKLVELLATVNKACEKSAFISKLVKSGQIFHQVGLNSKEAYTFLKEIPLYEESGISCRIPNWWKNKSNALKMAVTIGNEIPSRVTLDALVDFKVELSLGESKIDAAELKKLISEAEGLAFIKGKWVEVDRKKLEKTLKAYEQAQSLVSGNNMSMIEAMRFKLNAGKILKIPEEVCELEVSNGEWINSMITRLTNIDSIESIACGNDFHAKLRSYQERGLSWLYFMKNLGLGACLADDMGLGKTVQVIALLNYYKNIKKEKTLLIIPTSLIGNWMSEIEKFAPTLKYYILHPTENKNPYHDGSIYEQDYELFITTYGMLSKYEWIKNRTWDSVILDEAQAIKNPRTKQTRVVKQLKANYRIAMTGTPIENRLSDLWSLFDFLNKGLLGSSREFTDFTKKLKQNQDNYSKLKQVVSPFILRRLKTDKTIISDLPEKIEMKTYPTLTKKQIVLYTKLVEDLKLKIESTDNGIERKGIVLSSIMKFKQICNHPDQYLGQNNYAEKDSGKFERLREICENIYEKRERVIVFTQFKEITEQLSSFLETVFKHKGLVFHGSTAAKKRKDIVAKFQGEEYVPFMILSIKAGGVGLNLTSANHVIHFDRWWNPSVENQATDRAFRIGQMKNVIVHKFIVKGTIEEKIDLMIEDKTKLSKEIVSDKQENWITEMDNNQLMDLFKLEI